MKQDQPQRDRLARLLEELEREKGPIDSRVMEEVRAAWRKIGRHIRHRLEP